VVAIESIIEFKAYAGFKVVNQGDGDPLFDKVVLLCHFDRTTGRGAAYNEANRTRAIDKYFHDADTVITYTADVDAFEGSVVTALYGSISEMYFGEIIEPVANDATKIIVNGVTKPLADYHGDYGKHLSIRGKDWCFDARLKIPFPLDSEGTQPFDLLSTREISIVIEPQGGYPFFDENGVLLYHEPLFIDVLLNLGTDRLSVFLWRGIPIQTNAFCNLKLVCKDAMYGLWLDGMLIPVSSQSAPSSEFYYFHLKYSRTVGTNDFIKVKLEIGTPLPTYQKFGVPVVSDTFIKKTVEITPENINAIQSQSDFESLTNQSGKRVYRSKIRNGYSPYYPAPSNYIRENGIDSVLVTSTYIDVFFDGRIVEDSHRFYFPYPIESHFKNDLVAIIIGNTNVPNGTENQTNYYIGNLISNYKRIVTAINGAVFSVTFFDSQGSGAEIGSVNLSYVADATPYDLIMATIPKDIVNETASYTALRSDWFYQNSNSNSDDITSGWIYFFRTVIDNADAALRDPVVWEHLGDLTTATLTTRKEIISSPSYCFGIDRYIVTEDYIEIVFDDTFVEDTHKFYAPFKLFRTTNTSVLQNNYEAYIAIKNNAFSIEFIRILEPIVNETTGLITSYDHVSVSYPIQEFTATVNQWDNAIYNKDTPNSSCIKVTGYNLDEMRFTIDDSRFEEGFNEPTEPFPAFIENRIVFKPMMTMAATYAFGSNSFIVFEPRATFKDYTKKPKGITAPPTVVEPTPERPPIVPIELSGLSVIEFLPQSTFTVLTPEPVTPPTPQPTGNCDPLFNKVVLLMPCDSSPIIDVKGHAVTINSPAAFDATKPKWSGGSVKFDGDTNGYMRVVHDDLFSIAPSTIYCIEFWAFVDALPSRSEVIIKHGNTTNNLDNWDVRLNQSGNITFCGNVITGFVAGTWNYIRLTDSEIRLNDKKFTKAQISPNNPIANWGRITATSVITIGGGGISLTVFQNQGFHGYISDLRITIGDNRNGDTLPPTSKFPTIACVDVVVAPPVITPKTFDATSTIEFEPTATFELITPIRFEAISTIEFEPATTFNVYPPIRFEATSTIEFVVDCNFKQIKIELVYLPVENRSKASTGFVDKLLEGVGVAGILDNGTIELYTGNRPYSANHAITGKLLGTISGIKFDKPLNRIIRKNSTQMWMMKAVETGLIGWFRIKADADLTDYGQDSVREVRLDGEAGVDTVSFNFTVIAGDIYHIEDFAIMWGNG
jgi:hypothetical protein